VTALIELSSVLKDYKGLRPLRIEHLAVAPGDQVAILGVDRLSAEMLINLLIGTTLPDHGRIEVFGQSTADITDSSEWMAIVDRFGLVSERAVLLDTLSVIQNLAIPLSLDVEPPSEDVRVRAETLAEEVGLPSRMWHTRVGEIDAEAKLSVRLGRALALSPQLVLLEHPTAAVPPERVPIVGRYVHSLVKRRGIAALTLTADRPFAAAAADRVLMLNPANGRLAESRQGWFARLRGGA
jgi:ABC-type transporter Mla maintaining outer membrane lipid asymmetry ATPase subunit MlaF